MGTETAIAYRFSTEGSKARLKSVKQRGGVLHLGNPNHPLEEDFQQFKLMFDHLEFVGRQEFGPLIRRAFNPVTFIELGFDTDIRHISELKHLIDSQQEFRSLSNLEILSKSFEKEYCFSVSEFNLMSDTLQNTYSFSKELGYPSIALNSLSRALIFYRVLRFCFLSWINSMES